MSELKINNMKKALKMNMKQYTMFIIFIVMAIIFAILTDGTFLTTRNLSNLLLQTATIAILACGMVLIIVAGHIDLSVGSVAGFTGAIAAILQVKYGWASLPTFLIVVALGVMIGVVQGYWVAYVGIPSFIVTLAGMEIYRGAVIGVTKGATIGPLKSGLKNLGQGYVPNIFSTSQNFSDTTLIIGIIVIIMYIVLETKRRRSRIKYGFKVSSTFVNILKLTIISAGIGLFFSIMVFYRGIPYSILLVLALVAVYSFLSNRTSFGRHVFAIGGNKEAARLSGINIKKTNMLVFISMGFLSAVAGMVFTGRLNSATASAGNLFELNAIASCYIGGASAMGGEGSVIGAIIGSLVMATINNGMSLMDVSITWQYIVLGLILVLAVWFDILSKKKAA